MVYTSSVHVRLMIPCGSYPQKTRELKGDSGRSLQYIVPPKQNGSTFVLKGQSNEKVAELRPWDVSLVPN
jgi:hypothetical protein